MEARPEQNKQTVIAFYDLMFNQCKPAEAMKRYAGDVYIQHKLTTRGCSQPKLEVFMTSSPSPSPGFSVACTAAEQALPMEAR